jgi:hypothetical protein
MSDVSVRGRSSTPDATQVSTVTQTEQEPVGGKTGPAAEKTTSSTDSSPAQAKAAQQNATSKASDAKLQQHAQGLAPEQSREQQTKTIAESAKKSGLTDAEVTKLTTRLKGMDEKTFKAESKFLRDHVSNSPNADRAFQTYVDLKDAQDKSSKRVTDSHVHILTRGVAEPRTDKSKGQEGVLGHDGAMKAAKALTNMSKNDYTKVNDLLMKGGKGDDGGIIQQSNPQLEKALILKAAGARADEFGSAKEKLKTISGKESTPMSQVSKFADDIRGTEKSKLARETTAIDPYSGNHALEQRWNDSCGPTTTQGIKAEADPIYAKQLHREFIHSTSRGSDIAKEQKKWLEGEGGVAVKRGGEGGKGIALSDLLDKKVGKFTDVDYTHHATGGTEATRGAELDNVAKKLKKGQDVPIRAQWPDGSGHFMFLTDVRGSGNNQKFLLTDPWTGKTEWMTRQELVKPDCQFPADKGVLSHTYY